MVKNGVNTPQKVEDLAKSLGMDPVLLGGCFLGNTSPTRH